MTLSGYLRAAYVVARKDVLLELRSKRVLNTAAVFALLVVITFAFSFARSVTDLQVIGRGALWIAFVFAGTFGVTQSAAAEERDAALDGLLLMPVDRSAIYVGKVASNTGFVVVVELLTLGFVALFLGYEPTLSQTVLLAGVIVVAALGFSAAGVVLATLASKSHLRELLLPVLLVPLVVPVLLSSVELTRAIAAGGGGQTTSWLVLLCAYDGILFLAGLMTFEYVVET